MSSKTNNYDAFRNHMDIDILALLMAESRCTNMCTCCSEIEHDMPGSQSCDLQCVKHVKEWLEKPYDEKQFDRVVSFMYVPKEEMDE